MHTIRLRDPWELETTPGHVVYRRHFNRPTGLAPGDVVRLVIEQLPAGAVVSINGQPLPGDGAPSWDITPALQVRNAILIEIPIEAPPPERPFGEVRLEIS